MNFANNAERFWCFSLIFVTLAAAAVGPNIFPAAEAGYGELNEFAVRFLLPAVVVLAIVVVLARKHALSVGRSIVWGALAGAIATIPLEAVRIPGYLLGLMPGNLPRLMGVLLLNRFALGPSAASDIAGWSYHFWNGASFGIMYVLIFGTTRRWVGALYGVAIGVGFMLSPVVIALGVGHFGLQFSVGFPITVLAAHIGFGVVLGLLAAKFLPFQPSLLWGAMRSAFTPIRPATQPHRNPQNMNLFGGDAGLMNGNG